MWKIVFAIFAALVAVGQCIPGGFNDVDINDPNFNNALNFAVALHNNGITDPYLHQVVFIISAKVQVVAGFNYIIVVQLGRTNCEKGRPNNGCTVFSDPAQAQIYQCTFTVFSPLNSNGFQLLGKKCY
ncbi:cystatin-C-like [Fundulus heteroclitus]|uniref:cystatin-C-like n=1 Tax=Fundulus heteroclitus TaxID=8078 RepID=UPI00165C7649|nr:cystatin-C-like [Fundulus heteroclitus]